ncbi:hypothetical protein TorRG33x02_194950 [Trema orientale]|uniref:Uncharacterized protein n=1 Tax=Trema orientale TaxID=63057 RepID=A0A2P5EGK3_TREOI|nr:hypothetical protein TorRG33x02_194950 [Trema orientale]
MHCLPRIRCHHRLHALRHQPPCLASSHVVVEDGAASSRFQDLEIQYYPISNSSSSPISSSQFTLFPQNLHLSLWSTHANHVCVLGFLISLSSFFSKNCFHGEALPSCDRRVQEGH